MVELARKHTAKVHECLRVIRRIFAGLVAKREERKDGFARVIKKAMQTRLGNEAEEVLEALAKHGATKSLAKRALEIARELGRFTIFSLVDALTRIAGEGSVDSHSRHLQNGVHGSARTRIVDRLCEPTSQANALIELPKR